MKECCEKMPDHYYYGYPGNWDCAVPFGPHDSCCDWTDCGYTPKFKHKPVKECVKTYKTYYKLYKICTYCLYKVCPHCGLEFDYHECRGICPKCR